MSTSISRKILAIAVLLALVVGAQADEITVYVATDGATVYNAAGSAIGTLEADTILTLTGVRGGVCRVERCGKTAYMYKSDLSLERTGADDDGSTVHRAVGTAMEMDWWSSGIQKIFAKGTVAQITDVETGLSWLERRYGGSNHADSEPLTAADTAAMKRAYGGEWSWEQRAVFVTIDGINYAASIVGMPHDGSSIKDNDFDGHHCIHFTNSRTHGTNEVSAKHLAAIKKAASTTLE